MGMLVDGKWTDDDAASRMTQGGAFVRVDSAFRDAVTADGSSDFPAESARYHLFAAWNCPWAHRAVMYRKLKGLENVITMTRSEGRKGGRSWAYSEGIDELQPVDGMFELHSAYAAADPKYTGRVTVPTLWDRKKKTVVNNESSEIIRMFDHEFAAFSNDAPDFCPPELLSEIDEINETVYHGLNNGVYRAGFAKSQDAYEEAYHKVFACLDLMEERLSKQRYLVGNRLTEADWRAFPTLIRFDAVYYSHFKCNRQRIEDYPNLSNYTRELYQYPGIADTVDLWKFKAGYYGGMGQINPTGIVPLGPDLDFSRPHDRGRFPADG